MPSKVKKVHISTHSGKLEGLHSINTSPLNNSFCKKNSKIKSMVCSSCYTHRFLGRRPNAVKAFKRNGKLLSDKILKEEELPVLNDRYVRFHSFGELINTNHFNNFMNIARRNSGTTFALWTKRKDIVQRNMHKVPKNVILVYSTPKKDGANFIPRGFDRCFTVYSKEFVKKNKIPINCGGKKCLDCLICYKRSSGIRYVNEVIK